ncbi:MAG TPA: hypothetical protein VLF20_00460 [Patescibacteria group bacterium]|nr:hypothetical protein [Patescibacteria group bacterium]
METAAQPDPHSQATDIPVVDLKAPLKIDSSPQEEPTVNYGEKLFFFGMIFCGVVLAAVVIIAILWTQSSNQTQKVITVEQTAQ